MPGIKTSSAIYNEMVDSWLSHTPPPKKPQFELSNQLSRYHLGTMEYYQLRSVVH